VGARAEQTATLCTGFVRRPHFPVEHAVVHDAATLPARCQRAQVASPVDQHCHRPFEWAPAARHAAARERSTRQRPAENARGPEKWGSPYSFAGIS
jgi:hypothetical protein